MTFKYQFQVPVVPAYALTGHKAQGLTMLATYISLLRCWGFGLPYTSCTRIPFRRNMYFVCVPARDIFVALRTPDAHGMTAIDVKRVEIEELLASGGVHRDEDRAYYATWLTRLDIAQGLRSMVDVSSSFKLNGQDWRKQQWFTCVEPFARKDKHIDDIWPCLLRVIPLISSEL